MQTLNSFILYFFQPFPGRTFQYYTFAGILIILLIVLGIVLKLFIAKNRDDKSFRKLFKKYPKKLWYMSILLGVYLLVRYAQVPILSMRLFLYIILAAVAYLFYQIISTYLKDYPEEKKRRLARKSQNRYKVKKKKKRKK